MKSLTEDQIRQFLLQNGAENMEDLWICSIERADPSFMEGTKVIIGDKNTGKRATIEFNDRSLSISGDAEIFGESAADMSYRYTSLVLEDAGYSQSIDEIVENYKRAVVDLYARDDASNFMSFDRTENGSKQIILNAAGNDICSMVNGLKVRVSENGHEVFVTPVLQSYADSGEKTIEVGGLYWIDQGLVMPGEFGSVRPGVVLATYEGGTSLVVLSTSQSENFYNTEDRVLIPKSETNKGKDTYICPPALRLVNNSRIRGKIAFLKADRLCELQSALEGLFKPLTAVAGERREKEKAEAEQAALAAKEAQTSVAPLEGSSIAFISRKTDGQTQAGYVQFELTDDEVIAIAEGAIKKKQKLGLLTYYKKKYADLIFDDVSSVYCSKDQKTKCVSFNCSQPSAPNAPYCTMYISLFMATFTPPDSKKTRYCDDDEAQELLVKTMVGKYGERYKNKYAKFWVKNIANALRQGPNVNFKGDYDDFFDYQYERLNNALGFIDYSISRDTIQDIVDDYDPECGISFDVQKDLVPLKTSSNECEAK